jgi:hypothetical protein
MVAWFLSSRFETNVPVEVACNLKSDRLVIDGKEINSFCRSVNARTKVPTRTTARHEDGLTAIPLEVQLRRMLDL